MYPSVELATLLITSIFIAIVILVRGLLKNIEDNSIEAGFYHLPLLRTDDKLVVVDNKDEMIAFDTYRWYIKGCFTKEHMTTVFYMLENYKRKFGETENYSELYSDYVAKMVVLTETV